MTPGIKKKEIEDIFENLQHLLEYWVKFKKYLFKSFTQEPISANDETDFLEIKSVIAKYMRTLSEKIKEGYYFGSDKIQNLTRQCISISHLRTLPLTDRKGLLVDWHTVYVIITRVAGAFQFMKEGYIPKERARVASSVASVKAGASGKGIKKEKKKISSKDVLKTIVIIGILIGAVLFFLKRLGRF